MIQIIAPSSEELACAGGLKYVNSFDDGFVRCRCGRGFRYKSASGNGALARSVRKRIDALVIPPAWRDVWICADPHGHIQAIGRDELGRKQYIYHSRWHELSSTTKYQRMLILPAVLPKIRARVRADLDGHQLTRNRVLAAIVRVIDRAHIRVGNEQYVRERDTRGATTLTSEHVQVDHFTVSLDFPGKSGKRNEVEFTDRKVAKVIRQCEEIERHYLFSYFDEQGQLCQATSSDVNQYLREVACQPITAKDFRTWWGSVAALDALKECVEEELSASAKKRAIASAIRRASELLGNTMAVCRKSYVHPQVIASFEQGSLASELGRAGRLAARRATREMRAAECTFHAWLQITQRGARSWTGERPATK